MFRSKKVKIFAEDICSLALAIFAFGDVCATRDICSLRERCLLTSFVLFGCRAPLGCAGYKRVCGCEVGSRPDPTGGICHIIRVNPVHPWQKTLPHSELRLPRLFRGNPHSSFALRPSPLKQKICLIQPDNRFIFAVLFENSTVCCDLERWPSRLKALPC